MSRTQSLSGLGDSWAYGRRCTQNLAVTFHKRIRIALEPFARRLRNVYIEQDDAIAVIKRYDNPAAVFYVDPPYHPETCDTTLYRVNTADRDYHLRLIDCLMDVQGAVVLSGYYHPDYDRLVTEGGWKTTSFRVRMLISVDKRSPRVEALWYNRAAEEAKRRELDQLVLW